MVVEIIMKSGYIIVTLQHIIKRFVLCMCVFVYVGCCDVCGMFKCCKKGDGFNVTDNKIGKFKKEIKNAVGINDSCSIKIVPIVHIKGSRYDEYRDTNDVIDMIRGIASENNDNKFKIIVCDEYFFKNGVLECGDNNDEDSGLQYENNIINNTGNNQDNKNTTSFIIGRLKAITSRYQNILIIPNFLTSENKIVDQNELIQHVSKFIAFSGNTDFVCKPKNAQTRCNTEINKSVIANVANIMQQENVQECDTLQEDNYLHGDYHDILKPNKKTSNIQELIKQKLESATDIEDNCIVDFRASDSKNIVSKFLNHVYSFNNNEQVNIIKNYSPYIYRGKVIAEYHKSTYCAECNKDIECGSVYHIGNGKIKIHDNICDNTMKQIVKKYFNHIICRDIEHDILKHQDENAAITIIQANTIGVDDKVNKLFENTLNIHSDNNTVYCDENAVFKLGKNKKQQKIDHTDDSEVKKFDTSRCYNYNARTFII